MEFYSYLEEKARKNSPPTLKLSEGEFSLRLPWLGPLLFVETPDGVTRVYRRSSKGQGALKGWRVEVGY